jgi:hypothetical protein
MPKRYIVSTGPATTPGRCRVDFEPVDGDNDPDDPCPARPQGVDVPAALCRILNGKSTHHSGRPIWACADLERVLGISLTPSS